MDEEAQKRAEARRQWAGRKTTLQEMEEIEIVPGTAAERIGMVFELTAQAWAFKGGIPKVGPRSEWPGCIRRGTIPK